MAEGCRIQDAEISHSVVGVRSQIYAGAKLKDSILMGADYYSIDDHLSKIPIGIGPECHVEGAILDKNVRLGKGVVIKPFPAGIDLDHKNWYVRDGIVIIPKDTELAADTHITPKDL